MNPLELARELADLLEALHVPYAIGGALALGHHTAPRGTKDVDLNVFLAADEVRPVLEALEQAGYELDPELAEQQARERGDLTAYRDDIRVDVFVDSIPLHADARVRRVSVPMLGRPAWVLSAEDLVLFKMLFDRGKDWVDVEHVLAARHGELDAEYVRRQLADHVGEDDHRYARFEQLWADFRPGPASPGEPAAS